MDSTLLQFQREDSTRSKSTTYSPEGLIVNARSDLPRFGYHPTTKLPLGLMIEQPSANLLMTSNFENWRKEPGMKTDIEGLDCPDGSRSALRVYSDNSDSSSSYYLNVTSGTNIGLGFHTFSFWAKSSNNTKVRALIQAGSVNFKDITVTNQWKRYSVTGNIVTDEAVTLKLEKKSGLPFDIIVWGPQLEPGDRVTSYIPTSFGPRMRAPEFARITDLSWMNKTEGTWVVKWTKPISEPLATAYLFSVNNGSDNETIELYKEKSSDRSIFNLSAGDNSKRGSPAQNIPVSAFETRVTAFSYDKSGAYGFENGTTMGTVETSRVPTSLNFITFGYKGTTSDKYLNGFIKSVTYFPAKLHHKDLKRLPSQ